MADQNAKLAINIVSEFLGKAAFNQATKSVTSLERNVKNLGKAMVSVFAAQKLLAYSKSAVIAYKDDALAAKALTQTLNNLGLAFEDPRVKTLIAGLEKTYKVADDKLRPAFQSLLQVTGSVAKSQSILETALNLSSATGTDLVTVTTDLAQAYVGNLRGLRKYNLGLTQAEIAGKTFAQIQDLINSKFKEQALLKAEDPLNALSLAANNAKETIGKGLVDAINAAVGSGKGLNDIATNMGTLANGAATLIRYLGNVAGFISYGVKGLAKSGQQTADFLTGAGGYGQAGKSNFTYGDPRAAAIAEAKMRKEIELRAKAEKDAIARNKELAKLALAQAKAAADAAKAKKEAAILEKAQQLFNMDLIQNVAALQGKVTADEKLRLETQQALLTGNAESAGQLAMKLLEAQKNAMLLRQTDPFLGWTDSAASALAAIQKMIDALKLLGIEQSKTYMPSISVAAGTYYMSSTGQSSNDPSSPWYAFTHGLSGNVFGSTPTYTPTVDVNVSVVNGSIVADAQNSAMSGNSYSYSRLDPLRFG